MARNGSGFFNRMLNAIGIVDEPQQEDQFENRYASGRTAAGMGSNNRPSTYVPRQQNPRTADTRRRSVVQDERTPAARYNAPARNTYNNISEGYTVRRANAEPEDEFAAAAAASRRSEPARRAPEPAPRTPAPRNAANVPAPRQSAPRTVMFDLATLGECSEVVEALVANNIVLIILERMDDATIQRVVDTLSGAAFALHAKIRKASEKTYLIAPYSVEINDPGSYGRRGM